ncbi:ATP synthase F0 sector subunit b [hydrothermal vent metagenome]|uniref:ATP synthase F0 sector subunit b n=1 Tax=hydrothermal vent metagenome TaxID=652676 RepID=A0A3B0Y3Z8_9ZZZZ
MNINLTLWGQTITFFVFVWFCMKFVWPPIIAAMTERKEKIAEGLAAADRGKHEQELAQKKAVELLHEAKQQATEIISRGEKRAGEIVDEAKTDAIEEGNRLKAAAQAEIDQEVNRAREGLRGQVVEIATAGAGRILKRELDATANDELIKDLVARI